LDPGGTSIENVTVQAMNDPHVETLYYRVKHAEGVDYENARRLEYENERFKMSIEKGSAQITMKIHHASLEHARATVEPFLRAWELVAALEYRLGDFELVYERADVIDRNPRPSTYTLHAESGGIVITMGTVNLRVSRSKYPDPPNGIACDADVDLLFHCYSQYRTGKRTLADAAYFCLTVLERHNGRQGATSRYMIAKPILNTLGQLAGEKGGMEARKAIGAQTAFTSAEQQWLEEAMKRIIRRAAEVAHDPLVCRPQITIADMPRL
jgi:hypothetical protein